MDPSQLQPGYRLDRYELLCPLAYGGMASVWLARFGGRLGFERLVVVKMILPQYSQDPRFQEMFLDEARIASKIEHQNVARILDVGEDGGNYYIVMEWVDGDSLSKISRAAEQRKEKIPQGIALRICADAAAGLHAAHELKDRDGTHLGVVHRDVSPQNILVGNNGATMIIDFGVAKARDRVSQETSAGQLKGKIRYMAPEQALGKAIDHRADVWAIGAMLYEAFTGNPPYEGTNEVATLHKLTSGQPPPPLPDTFHPVIQALVNKALAYEAADRYATSMDLAQAIEKALVEIGEPTTAATVAHYTGQLLQDRKAARRRAVDVALEQAKKRDAGTPISSPVVPIGPISQGTIPLGQMAPPMQVPQSTPNLPAVGAPISVTDISSTPSANGQGSSAGQQSSTGAQAAYAQHGLGESPSATSNGTLGSASMEYPPGGLDPAAQARRRRYIGAAVVGVFGATGLVGAILIISAALMGHKDDVRTTAKSSEPPPAVSILPAATTSTPATTAKAPDPAPSDTVAATPDPTDTSTTTAANTPPPTTAPTTTATTAATAQPWKPPPSGAAVPTHKPWVPAATTTAKPGTKKPPDRGF